MKRYLLYLVLFLSSSIFNISWTSQRLDDDFLSRNSLITQFKEVQTFYNYLNEGKVKKTRKSISKWLNSLDRESDFFKKLESYFKLKDNNYDFTKCIKFFIKKWTKDDPILSGNLGYSLYKEDKIKRAVKYLKIAAENNDSIAQHLYADICYRNLDNSYKPLKEAAMWYLLSAENGYSESIFVLTNLVPDICTIQDPNKQMEKIVERWAIKHTLRNIENFKKILPKQIVDYMLLKNQKINLLLSQKLPYVFDKALHAIFHQLESKDEITLSSLDNTMIEDELEPILEVENQERQASGSFSSNKLPSSCSQELNSSPHELRVRDLGVFCQGPVYHNYLKSLQKSGYKTNDFLEKPEEEASLSQIPLFYKILLDSIHKFTKSKTGNELKIWSHNDYPWLLAGIQMWERKNPSGSHILTNPDYTNIILKQKLKMMNETIPSKIIEELQISLEKKEIWPSNQEEIIETSQISKDYRENVKKFFATQLSIENQLIQKITLDFFKSITQYKCHELNLIKNNSSSLNADFQTLNNPLFMFYCQEINIKDFKSNQLDDLLKAQRYFVNLKKYKIQCGLNTDCESKINKDYRRIIRKFNYHSEKTM